MTSFRWGRVFLMADRLRCWRVGIKHLVARVWRKEHWRSQWHPRGNLFSTLTKYERICRRNHSSVTAMKRAPKIRCYPRWVLSIGIAFLLLAGVSYFGRMSIADRPVKINRGIYGGNSFAIAVCAGLLLTGIGIYALCDHKD